MNNEKDEENLENEIAVIKEILESEEIFKELFNGFLKKVEGLVEKMRKVLDKDANDRGFSKESDEYLRHDKAIGRMLDLVIYEKADLISEARAKKHGVNLNSTWEERAALIGLLDDLSL